MERDFISFVFFAWIATSALIRFLGVTYVEKVFAATEGVNVLRYSALLTICSMVFYMLSITGVDAFLFVGYTISMVGYAAYSLQSCTSG